MPAVSLSFDRTISKAIFHKMWPTALSIIFNAFYLQGDRVILPLFVSQAEVGLYGAAYRVIDVVIQIAAIVMGMIMPLITFAWARGDKQLFKERAELGFNILTMLIFPMLVGIFVLAEPIMRFTAGATFSEAGTMLRWLSLCIVGICFGMVFGHIILAIDRQREALWVYASDAVLSLIGYLIFIPRFGWWGAVMVTLFSECYAGLGHTILTMYYSKTRFSPTVFFKVVIASVVMGTLLFALQPLPLLASILLGAFVYALLLIALRVTSWARISKLLRRARVVETP
jgi:O-antigen/teichoic acid export membrane protein